VSKAAAAVTSKSGCVGLPAFQLPTGSSPYRVHPVTVEWWGGQFTSAITDLDSAIISKVQRCHAEVSTAPQTIWATPYGNDLRLMHGIGTVPTIHYGSGDACLAHSPRECVSIDELLTATGALVLIAIDHCGPT
jgi:acetylornithine deacetylase